MLPVRRKCIVVPNCSDVIICASLTTERMCSYVYVEKIAVKYNAAVLLKNILLLLYSSAR